MKKQQYIKILNNNIRQSAEKLGLGHHWTFQHDDDPKHTAKVVKKWLADKNINVLQWPCQSPDLNPIENLWRELNIRVMARRPSNLKELELITKDEWAKIPVETCKKLLSLGHRLSTASVIHDTKNFKNVPQTLAVCHQRLLAYYIDSPSFLKPSIETEKKSNINVRRTTVLHGLPLLLGEDPNDFYKTCFKEMMKPRLRQKLMLLLRKAAAKKMRGRKRHESKKKVQVNKAVMDQLSEEVRQESPWTVMFADDIVICSESREQVEENLEKWRFALERRGMKVSPSKTEYMCVNETEGSGTVRLQGEEVKKVYTAHFAYPILKGLGSECRV
ncbi:hypothetical protein QTP70_011138 [Hemibagrus guttatus]|uniref:ribonuclease H n=1 Tax=Hemibagrus guttatus TaxID=175788 RepID=A0AAE0V2L9_9TELE|nr:hypothetical protein QTP70_011138 [Hemibagrus guttatus]